MFVGTVIILAHLEHLKISCGDFELIRGKPLWVTYGAIFLQTAFYFVITNVFMLRLTVCWCDREYTLIAGELSGWFEVVVFRNLQIQFSFDLHHFCSC